MSLRRACVCMLLAFGLASHADKALAQAAADSFGAHATTRSLPVAGETTLQASELQTQPAALGDPARALTNLPGIARASFDSGALSVWGGADSELRVYIDGVELPLLFHPGGFRSSVPEQLVSTLTMIKGAPSPELGRNLGAIVELETAVLHGTPSATLAIGTLDAAGSVQGAVGPVRVAWSGRLGYMDRLVRALAPRARDHLPVPEYADGFAKAQLSLDEHTQLSAAWLGAHDDYVIGDRAHPDARVARTLTQQRALQLVYLQYERRYADRARVRVTPFLSSFDQRRVGESAGEAWQLGSNEFRYGVRADYRALLGPFAVQLGFDAAGLRSHVARSGTLTLPPREGDVSVFGQAPGSELASDNWSTHDANLAPHGSLQLRLGRLTLQPGLRVAVQLLSNERALPSSIAAPTYGRSQLRVSPEPRIALRYFVSEPWQLSARVGLTQQAAAPEDRSALFGNPALEVASGWTAAAGSRLTLREGLTVELTTFYRRLSQLSTRNSARPLPLAAALVPQGRGHSYGAEISAQLRAGRILSGQLSYTLSRARRQDQASGPERFLDVDQTHVLSAIATLRLGAWQLGARARWATGQPHTAVVAGYHNLQDARFEPIFGQHNSSRLPDYFALDLRLEHRLTWRGLRLSLWLDVLNVSNQRNVEAVAYSYDFQTRQDVTGLPLLAVLGLRAEL